MTLKQKKNIASIQSITLLETKSLTVVCEADPDDKHLLTESLSRWVVEPLSRYVFMLGSAIEWVSRWADMKRINLILEDSEYADMKALRIELERYYPDVESWEDFFKLVVKINRDNEPPQGEDSPVTP